VDRNDEAEPACRENAISARFAPFSMISSDNRMISGLRRISTPSAPTPKSMAATPRYQAIDGPNKVENNIT
jgi:hypothetical protein